MINLEETPTYASSGDFRVVFAIEADLATPGLWDIMTKNNVLLMELQDARYANYKKSEFIRRLPAISDVYDSLDDSGKEIYEAYWRGKVSGRVNFYRYANGEQYFLSGFLPKKGDVVIDGGAFDGLTAREFAYLGCDVHSFELDKINFKTCEENAKKYGFTPVNMGLGEKKEQLKYTSGGTSGHIDAQGNEVADIIDIDTYFYEKDLRRIDFIKMDIEGAELSALRGAAATISKFKPKLAVCLYHKPEDLWEIPLYIKSLREDYEFSLRHYGADYKLAWELVLYAR